MIVADLSRKAIANGPLWAIRLLIIILLGGPLLFALLYRTDSWMLAFLIILTLRYARLVGNLIGYYIVYRPAPIVLEPRYTSKDVTVILPTIDPNGPDFQECLTSILASKPRAMYVVTVGAEKLEECKTVLGGISPAVRGTTVIKVSAMTEPSKRRQIAHAVPYIDTAITILCDDHVFWPSSKFLQSVLAPFDQNEKVGVVATNKIVRRTTPGKISWNSLVNFIACNYLQRHNWELRANNALDGGVFVVSGRTAIYRTAFIKNTELLDRFCCEKFFFGIFGGGQGLGPDDDNFLTREAMKAGYLVRFQDTKDATIETTLGEWPKFNGQLIRWARTTFRSNPVMLRNGDFCVRYPWSWMMVYCAGIVNFALL